MKREAKTEDRMVTAAQKEARRLRVILKDRITGIKLSECFEIIARIHGYGNWNSYRSSLVVSESTIKSPNNAHAGPDTASLGSDAFISADDEHLLATVGDILTQSEIHQASEDAFYLMRQKYVLFGIMKMAQTWEPARCNMQHVFQATRSASRLMEMVHSSPEAIQPYFDDLKMMDHYSKVNIITSIHWKLMNFLHLTILADFVPADTRQN